MQPLSIVNPASTHEHITRLTWTPNSITGNLTISIYTNYGFWKRFDGENAQRLNRAMLLAIEHVEGENEQERGRQRSADQPVEQQSINQLPPPLLT